MARDASRTMNLRVAMVTLELGQPRWHPPNDSVMTELLRDHVGRATRVHACIRSQAGIFRKSSAREKLRCHALSCGTVSQETLPPSACKQLSV